MAQIPDRVQSVLNNGYNFQLSEYISKGFNLFGKNAGLFIGYFFVYMAISLGLAFIPILGSIVSACISGALIAGNFIVADKTERGEEVTFSNFFDGFQSWVPLFIASLLQGLIILGILIPFVIYFFSKFGASSFMDGDRPDFSALDIIPILLLFAIVVYMSISFIYTPFFIVFDKMDSWQAMMASRKVVEKSFLMHFVFLFVWGLIIMVSILPVFLGLLVTIPAYACSIYAAWADITEYNAEPAAESDDILRHLID